MMRFGFQRQSALLIITLVALAFSAPAEAIDGGYDGGFYVLTDDKNHKLQFNLQMLARHTYVSKEAALDVNTFGLGRMRTYFSGHAFSPKFKYLLTIDYSGKGEAPDIRDGQVELALSRYFAIVAGRYFIAINREDIYNPLRTQLIQASVVSNHFEVVRDYGIMLKGETIPTLKYGVIVANGDGIDPASKGGNRNKEFLFGLRLDYNPLGKTPSSQGDIDYSRSPNLVFGGTLLYDMGSAGETQDFQSFVDVGIDPKENKILRGDIDTVFQWYGASFNGQWQTAYDPQFRSFDNGYVGQIGYYVIPKRLEVAGRFAALIPDFPFPALDQTGVTSKNAGSGVPVYETAGGLNYHIRGNNLKVQMDYTYVTNVAGTRNINDHRIQTQLGFAF